MEDLNHRIVILIHEKVHMPTILHAGDDAVSERLWSILHNSYRHVDKKSEEMWRDVRKAVCVVVFGRE